MKRRPIYFNNNDMKIFRQQTNRNNTGEQGTFHYRKRRRSIKNSIRKPQLLHRKMNTSKLMRILMNGIR